jgi:hypothetical protein
MYRDNTLIPTEAVRLAALGCLLEGERPYGELASELRYFIARMIGPSLDLLGTSLDLMCYEGLAVLAETTDGALVGPQAIKDSTVLRITDAGREAFRVLMASNIRAPVNDVTKLVVALKLRFLPLLTDSERADQLEAMAEMCEQELVRLRDLQAAYGEGLLGRWLTDEVDALDARHAMFTSLQTTD